jgi:hypothetical protein
MTRPMMSRAPWGLLVSLIMVAAELYATAEDIGPAVLHFAEQQLGKKVGDGECATLAAYAIGAAGGKSSKELGPIGRNADYVWGRPICTWTPGNASAKEVQPGDIIQFRDVKLTRNTKTSKPVRGSRPHVRTSGVETSCVRHTAIVRAVNGDFVEILEQNVKDASAPATSKVIQRTICIVSTKTLRRQGSISIETQYSFERGTMWIYRPYRELNQ